MVLVTIRALVSDDLAAESPSIDAADTLALKVLCRNPFTAEVHTWNPFSKGKKRLQDVKDPSLSLKLRHARRNVGGWPPTWPHPRLRPHKLVQGFEVQGLKESLG